MAETTDRPMIIGPDAGPEDGYPLQMEGKVISGFGRGSKEVRIVVLFVAIAGISDMHCSSASQPPIYP
jgi:riboflavin kinase